MTVGFALIVAIICGACVYVVVCEFQEYEKEREKRLLREVEELLCMRLGGEEE